MLAVELPAGEPVERDDGDDVAGAHPARREAGGQPAHAVHELRAGQPARGGDGDGGGAAAGADAAEAMRDVATAALRHGLTLAAPTGSSPRV